MFNTAKNYFVVICLLLSANTFAAELTEENVKILLSKVDLAVSNLDTDGIASALSDDVILIMNISMKDKTEVLAPSKLEFILMLQLGWLSVDNFKHSKTNEVIKTDGKKAVVTADVKETMTIKDQINYIDAQVKATIEIVSGNTLITKLVAYTTR